MQVTATDKVRGQGKRVVSESLQHPFISPENNAWLRTLIHKMFEPVILCKYFRNGTAVILDLNSEAANLMEIEDRDLNHLLFHDIFGPENVSAIKQYLKLLPHNGLTSFKVTLSGRRMSGIDILIRHSAFNTGLDTIVMFILNKLASDEKISEDLTMFRKFYEIKEANGRTGHWIYDFESGKVWVSPLIRSVFGLNSGSIKIADVAQLKIDSYINRVEDMVINLNMHGDLDPVFFEINDESDNSVAFYRSSAHFDYFDGIIYGIIEDISEKMELTRKLKDAVDASELSNERKKSFILNIRSEIYTRVNRIKGFTQLLNQESSSGNTARAYVDQITRACTGLIDVISDLIDISRIETEESKQHSDTILVNEFLSELLNCHTTLAETKGIPLLLSGTDLPMDFSIISDEGKLRKIFDNIIENAISYTSKGYVEFGCILQAHHIEFYVMDTGIGMTADQLQSINEMFSRTRSATTPNISNTAGLAIAKYYLDFLGGNIRASSTPGAGSTFYFTIPRVTVTPVVISAPIRDKEEEGRSRTCLVVEENEADYYFMKTFLSASGLNSLWARDEDETIYGSINDHVDCLLVNMEIKWINISLIGGIIRKKRPDLLIAGYNTGTSVHIHNDIEKTGLDCILDSPVSEKDLICLIEQMHGEKCQQCSWA
jgi:signal transduction histidine kinase